MISISDLTPEVQARMYDSGRPYMLVGKPGIAKTAIIEQFVATADLGYVNLHLTTMDAPDARGFLIPQKGKEGERPISTFTRSPIMLAIEATKKDRGILFLDEFGQSEHIMQKAIAPTLSERRVGDEYLPDGWVVWAASNRISDKAGVNRLLGHVANRVCILEVGPDMEGHVTWMRNNDIHPMMIAFCRQRPGVVYGSDAPAHPDQPFCTPRSVIYAHDYLKQQASGMHMPDDYVTQAVVEGFVGEGAAREMFAFFATANEVPTIEEVLANPATAKVPSMSRIDAHYAAVQMVVHHATVENIDTLFEYVLRLNKELQVCAVQQLITTSNGELMQSASLTKWVTENRSLIMATMS